MLEIISSSLEHNWISWSVNEEYVCYNLLILESEDEVHSRYWRSCLRTAGISCLCTIYERQDDSMSFVFAYSS